MRTKGVEFLLVEQKNPYPTFYERRGDERREKARCSHAGAPHQHRTHIQLFMKGEEKKVEKCPLLSCWRTSSASHLKWGANEVRQHEISGLILAFHLLAFHEN